MSDSWGGGLDPTTQAIIQFLLSSGADQSAPWVGAVGPDTLSQLSFGFDPTMMQDQSLAGFIPPSQDPEDAGSLEEAGRQGNYLQDFSDLTSDPVIAALMGGGSFAGDSFAPTVERELIARPATDQFNQWLAGAQQGEVSFEGVVAQAVQNGRSPRTAITQLRELLQRADTDAKSDNPDPDLQDQANQVRLMLPQSFQYDAGGAPLTGDASINWQRAFDDADALIKPYQEEQQTQPGPIGATYDQDGNQTSSGGTIVVGPDGQYYRETTTESPLAEKYRELGIPLPTETYEAGDFLGASWQQANQAYLDNEPQMDEAYRQLLSDRDMALQNATGANLSQSDVFRMDSMDNSATRAMSGAAPTSTPDTKQQSAAGTQGPIGVIGPQDVLSSWERLIGDSGGSLRQHAEAGGIPGIWGTTPTQLGAGWEQMMEHGGQAAGGGISTALGDPTQTNPAVGATSNAVVDATQLEAQRAMSAQAAMARLLDNWGGGLAAGAQTAAGSPVGQALDIDRNWLATGIDNWFGGLAGGARSVGGWLGLGGSDEQSQAASGNAGPGIGGGGAGGVGSPRSLDDLANLNEPGQPPQPEGIDYLDYWLNANGNDSYEQSRAQPPLPPPGDANTLAMIQQMLNPQDQRVSDFERQRAEQFAHDPAPATELTNLRPHPDQRAVATGQMTIPNQRITDFENQRAEQFAEPEALGLSMLWPGDQRQASDQGTTNVMLRMLFGMDAEERSKSRGSKRLPQATGSSGKRPYHQASAVDTYRQGQRSSASRINRAMAASNVSANQQYRNLYGRDYWQARGYAEALQSLGVTPTSVALANRTGGINRLMGR